MLYVVKKLGTGLTTRAGSSFGGVTAPTVDADSYLSPDGSLVADVAKATRYIYRDTAEQKAAELRSSFSQFEVVELP